MPTPAGPDYPAAALDYATRHLYPVTPGTRRTGAGCTCGNDLCSRPGAHPASPTWRLDASNVPAVVTAAWNADPDAPVLMACGLTCAVLAMPTGPGLAAVASLAGIGMVGPVLELPGGDQIAVWASVPFHGLARRQPVVPTPGLRWLEFVPLPPTGGYRWLVSPLAGRPLPYAGNVRYHAEASTSDA